MQLRNLGRVSGRVSMGALAFACVSAFGATAGAQAHGLLQVPPGPGMPRNESICGGVQDWQDVEQYNGTLGPFSTTVEFVSRHQGAVGNIKWEDNFRAGFTDPGNIPNGTRWCTGTLISRTQFLTAGHCFDPDPFPWRSPRINGTTTPIPATTAATLMEVAFNYQEDPSGNLRTETRYAVTALSEYRLGGLDYAVLTLAGNPGDTWPIARVAASGFTAGDELTIIQHPDGLPKVVHSGEAVSINGNYIEYADADTIGGSSGSGVLDWQGRVVAVHTEGGCNTVGTNRGMRMDKIVQVSPIMSSVMRENGPYSDVIASGDFDGDGFEDLAVGVPSYSVGTAYAAGAVRVLYSDASGPDVTDEQIIHQDSSGVEGAAEAGDFFGTAVAAGDFNGDGIDDLAVGVPGEDLAPGTDQGAIHVFYGDVGGLDTAGDQLWHQDSSGIDGVAEDGDHFGASLAAGDFDGTGDWDLAIGIPDETVSSIASAGAVAVLYGTAAGLDSPWNQLWHQDSSGVDGNAEAGDRFGVAVAAGDFDGNGSDDLAVGVPGEDLSGAVQTGVVAVLYSDGSVLSATGNEYWDQDTLSGVLEAGDRFGVAVAAGDINGNGFADLLIGVPGENVGSAPNAGAIHAVYGTSSGLTTAGEVQLHQDTTNVPGAGESEDRFGSALATGFVNSGSRADVIVGAPGDAIGSADEAGAFWVFYGSSGSLSGTSSAYFTQDTGALPGASERGDRFGASLACGDFDGDGFDDVGAGVPGEDVGSTATPDSAQAVFGASGGLTDSGSLFL